jgi:hypothetical protein
MAAKESDKNLCVSLCHNWDVCALMPLQVLLLFRWVLSENELLILEGGLLGNYYKTEVYKSKQWNIYITN